jgi:inner membrane protein YidH
MTVEGPTKTPTSIELADDRTRLALVRTMIALDRTLMAWVRTVTSLISFGFTIYKIFQAIRESRPNDMHIMTPRAVALVMMSLGIAGLTVAAIEYRAQRRDLETSYPQYGPFRRSPALPVAGTIAVLGVLGFVLVFLRQ